MSQEFTEDGAPIFIDTSGHLSVEQRQDIYRRIARLEEGEKDNREWLRELAFKVNDLTLARTSKRKWWKVW
jgi:hypothetical protein